ncbi:hypothetical protein BGZ76_010127 [Entomortierella beljakovae]|nr:hypothetical protein BGZ76_010127 [Entomortierella beljakovae]
MRFSVAALALFLTATVTASPTLEKRIIGGGPVYKGELPFIAQLVNKRSPCTGFVIGPYTIMTAAHCLRDRTHTGVQYGGLKPKQGKTVEIAKFVPHPEHNSTLSINDIGLIFVKEKINLRYYANYAGRYPRPYTQVRAAGYGYTDNNGTESKYLHKVDLNVATKEVCKQRFPKFESSTQYCTKDIPLGHAVCGGDSGGPVYTGEGRHIKVSGIVSHGVGANMCGEKGGYQYYTYIKPYIPWVRREIRKYERSL